MLDSENKEIVMKASNLASNDSFHVSLVFWLPIPKSFNRNKKKAVLEGFVKHTTRPDLDNLEKFVLDAANGVLWADDSKIIKLSSEKNYAEIPQTFIKIEAFKSNPIKPKELTNVLPTRRQTSNLYVGL